MDFDEESNIFQEDTIENRLKCFVKRAVITTMKQVEQVINASLDASNAEVNEEARLALKLAKPVAEAVDIPVLKGVLGIAQEFTDKGSQYYNHRQAKKIHTFLIGLSMNNEEWMKTLIEVYTELFIAHNLQFNYLLSELKDTWENAMNKLAKDANYRFFSHLQVMFCNNEESNPDSDTMESLTPAKIFDCFENGNSNREFRKMVKTLECKGQGGTIRTLSRTYYTCQLFDEPININQIKVDEDINEYLYEYDFRQEKITNCKVPKVRLFLKNHDKFYELRGKKVQFLDEIFQELQTSEMTVKNVQKNLAHVADDVNRLGVEQEKTRHITESVSQNLSQVCEDVSQAYQEVSEVKENLSRVEKKFEEANAKVTTELQSFTQRMDQILSLNVKATGGKVPNNIGMLEDLVQEAIGKVKLRIDEFVQHENDHKALLEQFEILKSQFRSFKGALKDSYLEVCSKYQECSQDIKEHDNSDTVEETFIEIMSDSLKRLLVFLQYQLDRSEEYLVKKRKEVKKLQDIISHLKINGFKEQFSTSVLRNLPTKGTKGKILINLSGKGFCKKRHPLQEKLISAKEKFQTDLELNFGDINDSDDSDDDIDSTCDWHEDRISLDFLNQSMREALSLKEHNDSMGFELQYTFGKITKAMNFKSGTEKVKTRFGDIIFQFMEKEPIIVSRHLPKGPFNVAVYGMDQTFSVDWECEENKVVPTTGKILNEVP